MFAFRVPHLRRYRDIVSLLARYRGDIVKQSGLGRGVDTRGKKKDDQAEESKPDRLAKDLEQMGPTFIKLGQLLSTRADLLPEAYLDSLSRLQDDVQTLPAEVIRETVERELGTSIDKAFQEFEDEPVASGSIAQVHRGILPSGRKVVVKVQRPGIHKQIVEDFEALEQVAHMVDKHTQLGRRYEFERMVTNFRETLLNELNFSQEAENLRVVGANVCDFDHIMIPQPVADYTTDKLLTMDYITGVKITKVSKLVLAEIDGATLADELYSAYLKQFVTDGFFHADPHPGNVFLTHDHRIALLDLGMVHRISAGMQEQLLRVLMAISQGRGEDAALICTEFGDLKKDFDPGGFRAGVVRLVGEQHGGSVGKGDFGARVMSLVRVAAENGLRLPRAVTMIGKVILNLERVGAILDPTFDPNAAIRRHVVGLVRAKLKQSLDTTSLLMGVSEVKQLVERLPLRLNHVLEQITNNDLKMKIDAIDEKQLMSAFQKLSNRLTVGMILAAIIIGASLIMNVETRWTVLGYPVLAVVFFLVAAVMGLMLVVNILWVDVKTPREPKL